MEDGKEKEMAGQSEDSNVDRFTQLMFGTGASERKREEAPQSQGLTNNVNYEEIMKSIDLLMDSAKQLKPLFNNISPMITKFFNKK